MRRLIRLTAAIAFVAATVLSGAAPQAAAQPASRVPAPGHLGGTAVSAPAAAPATLDPVASPIPVLAFYYIWFDSTSWLRAKTDYPKLGRYTSDDPAVMRQHVQWAKAAGITGFIVSWKDTPTNNRRLSLLMEVARQQRFQLAMIYQGLDFERRPLPVERVAADFEYFRSTYAADPVFTRMGGKPLTIWSGTWAYSRGDVERVTAPVRASLRVLNTEKNVEGYERIADLTDGDAYYWSSVNPATYPDYGTKLNEMSRAVHRHGQYWIAPFAPGFDARLVGGEKSVPRNGGDTLRTEYATAVASSPDALGLISWNEFSENSFVEPSVKEGHTALHVLSELRREHLPPSRAAADSSEPKAASPGQPVRLTPSLVALAGFLVLLVGGVACLRPVVRRHDAEALGIPDARPGLTALPSTPIDLMQAGLPAPGRLVLKSSANAVNGSPAAVPWSGPVANGVALAAWREPEPTAEPPVPPGGYEPPTQPHRTPARTDPPQRRRPRGDDNA
jgi:hypothetical protein